MKDLKSNNVEKKLIDWIMESEMFLKKLIILKENVKTYKDNLKHSHKSNNS